MITLELKGKRLGVGIELCRQTDFKLGCGRELVMGDAAAEQAAGNRMVLQRMLLEQREVP